MPVILFILFLATILFYACTRQSHPVTAKYSKGGLENATIKTGCTYPAKRYTKDRDLKVKNSIDSLSTLTLANLDLGVRQTVTRLTDYSTEGTETTEIFLTGLQHILNVC